LIFQVIHSPVNNESCVKIKSGYYGRVRSLQVVFRITMAYDNHRKRGDEEEITEDQVEESADDEVEDEDDGLDLEDDEKAWE